MTENTDNAPFDPALGAIEPHAGTLTAPPDGQQLYKIMTIENLLRSVSGGYLYFNRVDSYKDFRNADGHDGEQLQQDRAANEAAKFERAPDFSGADYYDRCRNRTYACCFSLENSDYIWHEYGNGSAHGKVGIAFDFAKLRAVINEIMSVRNGLLYRGNACKQIFSVNYGIVDYLSWEEVRENIDRMPNPIRYTYVKDKSYADDPAALRRRCASQSIGLVRAPASLNRAAPVIRRGFLAGHRMRLSGDYRRGCSSHREALSQLAAFRRRHSSSGNRPPS